MSAIILSQLGTKAYDPKSGSYYDPWSNHIWDVLRQIRLHDKNISISFIIDVPPEQVPESNHFKQLNITPVNIDSLKTKLNSLKYFESHHDPLWKTSLYRFFYMQEVMESNKIQNCVTFDNDVLVYSNLSEIIEKISDCFINSAITPVMESELVCGMFWIRNSDVLRQINEGLLYFANNPFDGHTTEMKMLYQIQKSNPSLIENLPIWPEGNYSNKVEKFSGIFDPCTISQYLAGCNNGQAPGTILMHHILGKELKENKYKVKKMIENGNIYFELVNQSGERYKIHSLHMHRKSAIKNFINL